MAATERWSSSAGRDDRIRAAPSDRSGRRAPCAPCPASSGRSPRSTNAGRPIERRISACHRPDGNRPRSRRSPRGPCVRSCGGDSVGHPRQFLRLGGRRRSGRARRTRPATGLGQRGRAVDEQRIGPVGVDARPQLRLVQVCKSLFGPGHLSHAGVLILTARPAKRDATAVPRKNAWKQTRSAGRAVRPPCRMAA
jgi:hypothetical protein